jgi:beta-galactosidase
VPKAPGQMRLGSMQALAHGSDGVMFFQWRQAKFGPEKFHSAMLGHRGERSRTFQETKALGAELSKLAAIKDTSVRASVALVADWDSWWGLSAPDSLPSQRLDWLAEARAWHAAAFALGQTVDVARAAGPFGEHSVVLVPNLYAVTAQQADALAAFVADGGHLVVGPFSGVVDHCEQVHPGGAPGPLRGLLGVEVDEWWPLVEDERRRVAIGDAQADVRVWSEWLEVDAEAEVIASFVGGELSGLPAITRRSHGRGVAWYLGAGLDEAGMRAILSRVFAEAGIRQPITAADSGEDRQVAESALEVVTRTDGVTDFTFLLNHGRQKLTVTGIAHGVDLLSEVDTSAGLTLGAFGVAVVKHPAIGSPTSTEPSVSDREAAL